MDHRERFYDPLQAILMMQDAHQARIWTAMPGIIESFDADAITCVVQPAIMGITQSVSADGTTVTANQVALPVLVDVPVVFPRGGGYTLTFPVAAGDECLVVIACRCIDAWWQNGGVQPQLEVRLHHLADGFAIPGPFSQVTKIGNLSSDSVQLRSNDGTLYLDLNSSTGTATVLSPTQIILDTPVVSVTGVINIENTRGEAGAVGTVNGTLNVINDVVAGYGSSNTSLLRHVHGGVQPGGGMTSAPLANVYGVVRRIIQRVLGRKPS